MPFLDGCGRAARIARTTKALKYTLELRQSCGATGRTERPTIVSDRLVSDKSTEKSCPVLRLRARDAVVTGQRTFLFSLGFSQVRRKITRDFHTNQSQERFWASLTIDQYPPEFQRDNKSKVVHYKHRNQTVESASQVRHALNRRIENAQGI